MQNNLLNFLSLTKRFCFTLCLFVCPLVFLTDTTQNPFIVQPLFFSIFGSAFLLCCAAEFWLKKEIVFKYSRLDFAFLFFLFSLAFSLIYNYSFGDYKTALINEFLRKADYIIYGLFFGFLFAKISVAQTEFNGGEYKFFKNILLWCLLWLLWKVQSSCFVAVLIFAVAVYLCFRHLKNYGAKQIFDVLLAVCFCACLYGILQTLGFDLFWKIDISRDFGFRPVSTFGNPNFLASFTLLFLPYALLLFFNAKGKKENLLYGFITLVQALFLGLSGTRSAWLGLFAPSVLFLILSPEFRKIFVKKYLKIIALLFVFGFCFYGVTLTLREGAISAPQARISEVKQALKLKDISLQNKEFIQPLHQRLMMWTCVFESFKKTPFLGAGVNSFQLRFPFCQGRLIAQNPALDKIKMQANAAHNEFLEILFDGGLISFFAYFVLIFLFFKSAACKIKVLDKENKLFYLALLFGIIAVLFDNLFNITLRTLLVSFAFWFSISLVNNLQVKGKVIKLNKFCGFAFFVVLACLAYLLISWQAKQFLEQKYELKGYKYLVSGRTKEAAKEMENALKFSALRPEPFYTLLNIYIELKQLNEAEILARKAVEIYPAYYEIFFRLAALQNAQNKQTETLGNLRQTLALNPAYTPAAELFANILAQQNKVAEKDKILLENLSKNLPYEVNLTSYLAEINFKEKNCGKAKIFALQTLNKNIFDKVALNIALACKEGETLLIKKAKQLNALRTKLKNSPDEKIFEDIKNLLTQSPNDFEINTLLAEFYFKQGNFCEAKNILIQLKPQDFSKAHNFALALSSMRCNDVKTAQKALEEILFFDPYDELARTRLKNVNI